MQAENLAQAANLIWGFDPKVIATAIVVVCYIILFTEKLNRAVVALLGACVMIFSGILTQATALQGIDFNTISLLVGMMTIVGISEKSGMFQNMGENQIKEIIHAAVCSVFFIDESQRVTLSDIGSVAEIEKWADLEESEVVKMQLVSQFRCNGSDGYLAWLDQALEIRETANYDLDGIDYDIRICNTPAEMEAIVLEKNRIRNRARILAGYCWNWPKATRNNTNFHDIKIGDYSISWNLNGGDAFAISEESVHEAGCIHTSQGLEFDYTGVIIGDDMRFENGKVITDYTKRAKTDNSLKGIKTLAKKDKEKADQVADEIIKNTYRTLMTRGMKGCYVYCTDVPLAQHFKKLLKQK